MLNPLCVQHNVGQQGRTSPLSFAKLCCQFGELARHASTLFTLMIYAVAPVRVDLFITNEMPLWPGNEPAWADPVSELLRLISSTSDTL